MGKTVSAKTVNKNAFAFLIVFFAGVGGILYGYDLGVIAGALPFMKNSIAMTDAQLSFIVGAVLGGGSIAILISGVLAEIFGRKKMILISALVFMAGIIILVSARSFLYVLAGRLIQGVGVGIVTIIIPLYLAEVAPARIRGRSVTVFQMFLTGGILLAYCIDLFFTPSGNWRGMFVCALLPGAVLFGGSLIIPESPAWLFSKGKEAAALKILRAVRSKEDAEKETKEMVEINKDDKYAGKETGRRKFNWERHYFYPLLIALGIAVLNQLTGINTILQYDTLIFKEAGLHSNVVSMIGSTGVGLLNLIVTIIAFSLIDKVGRRPLLITGTAGVTLALMLCGIVSLMPQNDLHGYLLMAGFVLFIMFFAIGPGVVVWLALSELLPTPVRSVGMGICLFANSFVSFGLASIFLPAVNKIGYGPFFWLCGGLTFIYFLIAKFILPETKDKTLEEIEMNFIRFANKEQVGPGG